MSQARLCPISALVLGFAILMGSVSAAGAAEQAGVTTLWQARWQYVRITPRDGGLPNLHPSRPAKADIRSALAQIKLDPGDGEAVEFLTPEERNFYSDQLAKALNQAGPDQDVVISSIGMRRTLLGLSEPKITTARIFVNQDGLNVIVGETMLDAPNDTSTYTKPDPRLVAFADGSRSGPAHSGAKWKLVANGAGILVKRSDWVAVPASVMAVPEPGSEEAQKQAQTQLNEVQSQVQQLRQQIQAAPPQVEDRLRALDALKTKGLVTPEEYTAKRKQILDSL